MRYGYAIEIKREPQKIRYQDRIEISNGLLTLDMLSKYIKHHESFGITEERHGAFDIETILTVIRERLETKEELDKRVAKEERYMENYRKHQEKYGKK